MTGGFSHFPDRVGAPAESPDRVFRRRFEGFADPGQLLAVNDRPLSKATGFEDARNVPGPDPGAGA